MSKATRARLVILAARIIRDPHGRAARLHKSDVGPPAGATLTHPLLRSGKQTQQLKVQVRAEVVEGRAMETREESETKWREKWSQGGPLRRRRSSICGSKTTVFEHRESFSEEVGEVDLTRDGSDCEL